MEDEALGARLGARLGEREERHLGLFDALALAGQRRQRLDLGVDHCTLL
jgi:hypothetical protein